MAKGIRSLYAGLANRFQHLASNASEDEEESRRAEDEKRARKAREEGDEEEDEDEDDISEEEKNARAERNAKRREKAAQRASEEEDGEDEGEDDEKARKAGSKARASERKRWNDVLASAPAKGRVALACSLLADTGMSAEKICGLLTASPTEARHGLAARMAGIQRPDIGSTASAGPAAMAPNSPRAQADAMTRAYHKALGIDPQTD